MGLRTQLEGTHPVRWYEVNSSAASVASNTSFGATTVSAESQWMVSLFPVLPPLGRPTTKCSTPAPFLRRTSTVIRSAEPALCMYSVALRFGAASSRLLPGGSFQRISE